MKVFRAKYPATLRLLYPKRISLVQNSKAIYLTFDDGPVPEVTPWVLEELARFNAKASFFCIGDNVKKYPEIFRKVIKEGHCIGNHTFNHLNGWNYSTSNYIENTRQAEEIMVTSSEVNRNENSKFSENKTPVYQLFRPPYGRIRNSQARSLKKQGYKLVMWDVISGDYDQEFSAEKCFQNVIDNAESGSTIVLHDSQKAFQNLSVILPKILEYYKNKGLEFRSLKDAL
ncbi:MAG: polysaccharide deacetylase family protein [Christiangramia sp.]|nr:polysaccharide deacetylase family protein [Christiangramia sp.]